MKSGQFVKGKIDGIQKYFASPDLPEIFSKEIRNAVEDYSEVGIYPRFFKKEKVLSKTVVTEAENSDGRKDGIINYTVLYKWDQTVTKDEVKYIFPLEEFISEILDNKRSFKMPTMPELPSDTDFGLIDLPPAIEWEVF